MTGKIGPPGGKNRVLAGVVSTGFTGEQRIKLTEGPNNGTENIDSKRTEHNADRKED
jgi:hypothetical protein